MKQRSVVGGPRLRRTKSSKLPLETIPTDMVTLHLMISTSAFHDIKSIQNHVQVLTSTDKYISCGRIDPAIPLDTESHSNLKDRLQRLVETHYRHEALDGSSSIPHIPIEICTNIDGESR
jgi:hypothetical protein